MILSSKAARRMARTARSDSVDSWCHSCLPGLKTPSLSTWWAYHGSVLPGGGGVGGWGRGLLQGCPGGRRRCATRGASTAAPGGARWRAPGPRLPPPPLSAATHPPGAPPRMRPLPSPPAGGPSRGRSLSIGALHWGSQAQPTHHFDKLGCRGVTPERTQASCTRTTPSAMVDPFTTVPPTGGAGEAITGRTHLAIPGGQQARPPASRRRRAISRTPGSHRRPCRHPGPCATDILSVNHATLHAVPGDAEMQRCACHSQQPEAAAGGSGTQQRSPHPVQRRWRARALLQERLPGSGGSGCCAAVRRPDWQQGFPTCGACPRCSEGLAGCLLRPQRG